MFGWCKFDTALCPPITAPGGLLNNHRRFAKYLLLFKFSRSAQEIDGLKRWTQGIRFLQKFSHSAQSCNSGPAPPRPLASSPCRPAFHFTWSDTAFPYNFFHRWQRFMESRRFGPEAWSLIQAVFAFSRWIRSAHSYIKNVKILL